MAEPGWRQPGLAGLPGFCPAVERRDRVGVPVFPARTPTGRPASPLGPGPLARRNP